MSDAADRKLEKLRGLVRETGGLAVAFSGGVDSTFLAAVAQQELGDRALAVTALSPTYPAREQEEARALAQQIGIRHELVESNELDIPGFADNPPDRCYHCKAELFGVVRKVAARFDIREIAVGANADDVDDYRPGMKAAEDCGVRSPLLEAGLGKDEIRELSRRMDLPTAEKPSFACLASRFPYGSRITGEKLKAVDTVESALREMGFKQLRVRHHGDVARIELDAAALQKALVPETRAAIVRVTRAAGFAYVTLDLEGYRTGSMNEVLNDE